MSLAILQANLGSFDLPVDPVKQDISTSFHRWDDINFPPVTGLTPRFQYRIPKYFGWQMFEGYENYLWLDGALTLSSPDSAQWFLEQLGQADIAVFKHPWRSSIEEETNHIENYLTRQQGTNRGQDYIIRRYENGLHKEQLKDIQLDKDYIDDHLYTSAAFIYRDSEALRDAFRLLWLHQSRYYTCDQLAFTYALHNLNVKVIPDNPFKCKYLNHVSKHN